MSMETVALPVQPPLEPMLAEAPAKVPTDVGVSSYEPKGDGALNLSTSWSAATEPLGRIEWFDSVDLQGSG